MVSIVLVNWNTPGHTLLCLASLMRLDGPQPNIMVCDNASRDGSYAIIREALLAMLTPPRPDWQTFRFQERVAGRSEEAQANRPDSPEIVLLGTPRNLGFAGGVNVCLRYALANTRMEYAWVLNNDTAVDARAMTALLEVMRNRPEVGLCGSTLLYFNQPRVIQAVGGTYHPWWGTTRHLLAHQPYSAEICRKIAPDHFDYVVGGSLFFRRAALERVGLLAEDYFLFFEELDWIFRQRRMAPDLKLGYAPDSIVYHQEGASTGVNGAAGKTYRYEMDYFFQTSRLRFARRFFPLRYWVVRTSLLGVALNRIRRRQWRSLRLALGLLVGWVPPGLVPVQRGHTQIPHDPP